MTFEIDGQTVNVLGHVDAYDPETATIYELKTTRFAGWQVENGYIPHENHVAQVQCYQTLLEQYGIPVKRLVLVYVDDSTIHPKLVPLGNRREWMIQRASAVHKALLTQELPRAEVGYWCRYCSFFTICPRKQEASLYRKDRK
jgi:CRISPR/Cas system-associated exonuclease Cas4 (RecB family)